MSAPQTNIEKQKRRHIVPLLGMALVVLFGLGLIIYWQFEEAAQGDSPGVEEPSDPGAAPNTTTPPAQP